MEPRNRRIGALAIMLTAFASVVSMAGVNLVSASPTAKADNAAQEVDDEQIPVPRLAVADIAALPVSTTFTQKPLPYVPTETSKEDTEGTVVHPTKQTVVFAVPGSTPVALLPTMQAGNDTWVPVTDDTTPGWLQVLLPSRPNGSTGWISDAGAQLAHSDQEIRVHRASKRLDLVTAGKTIGSWTVGVGTDKTPTPLGRTFILAAITDSAQKFSPVIYPLGTHSQTLDAFGGGVGTVGIHGWPSSKAFGTASSNGCIRVPAAALAALAMVPLGSLVLITND
jgi:lipoprotein-anchoring transpeptidase ErfK/SrfK